LKSVQIDSRLTNLLDRGNIVIMSAGKETWTTSSSSAAASAD
jgi:hypothetical protein